MEQDKKNNLKRRTVAFRLFIEYTEEGRDTGHAETAARIALRQNFVTIENGVSVERVALYDTKGRTVLEIEEPHPEREPLFKMVYIDRGTRRKK